MMDVDTTKIMRTKYGRGNPIRKEVFGENLAIWDSDVQIILTIVLELGC
jgi:hypothetical protein